MNVKYLWLFSHTVGGVKKPYGVYAANGKEAFEQLRALINNLEDLGEDWCFCPARSGAAIGGRIMPGSQKYDDAGVPLSVKLRRQPGTEESKSKDP